MTAASVEATSFIITDTKALKNKIENTRKSAVSVMDSYQQLAVSTIVHAAQHGDTDVLNRFYKSLNGNFQTGFKLWVSQIVSEDYPKGTKSDVFWIGLNREKGFFVRKNTQPHRHERFISKVNDIVALRDSTDTMDPDVVKAKAYGRFFEKQTDASDNPNLFTDSNIIDGLMRLVKRAQSDKENVQVHDDTAAMLEAMALEFRDKVYRAHPEIQNIPAPAAQAPATTH